MAGPATAMAQGLLDRNLGRTSLSGQPTVGPVDR